MKHLVLHNPAYRAYIPAFRDYLQSRGYAKSTCYNLPHQVQELLYFLEGQGLEDLKHLKPAQVNAFRDYLQSRGHRRAGMPLSNAYLNKYLQALKRFGEYLQESEAISLSLNLQALKASSQAKIILSTGEVQALYAACGRDALGQRDRAMLAIYYACGLRREEGERLNAEDVQLSRSRVYVRPGKNGQDRYVPLTEAVIRELEPYHSRGRALLCTGNPPDAFFLRAPGKRVQSQSLLLRLKKLLLRAGIAKDIGLHSLRHSIATHLWQAGMPLPQVARFLGHRSLESTQIYTHIENYE